MNYRPPRTPEELDAHALKLLIQGLRHPCGEEKVLEAALKSAQVKLAEHQRQVLYIDLRLGEAPKTTGYDGWHRRQMSLRAAWARGIPKLERRIAAIQEALIPFQMHAELERLVEEMDDLVHDVNVLEFGCWLGLEPTEKMLEDTQEARHLHDVLLKRAREIRTQLNQSEVGRRLLTEMPVELDHASDA